MLYVRWKGYDNFSNSWVDKKKDIVQIYILCNISQYFPKPYSGSIGHVKVERDLSNYATRAHLKEATGADIFNLAA